MRIRIRNTAYNQNKPLQVQLSISSEEESEDIAERFLTKDIEVIVVALSCPCFNQALRTHTRLHVSGIPDQTSILLIPDSYPGSRNFKDYFMFLFYTNSMLNIEITHFYIQ